jgi:prophage DNA circulation protein
VTTIRDVHLPFRDALLPASFKGAMFHVSAGGKESGRRIVVHEFPKRELPYSEDMGRKSFHFSVRGYCITYPIDTDVDLYSIDYRRARNALISALESEGSGTLQLPTLDPFLVACSGYTWSETEREGGYCVFDMTFSEQGLAPAAAGQDTRTNLISDSIKLADRVATVMEGLESQLRRTSQQSAEAGPVKPSPQ